MRLSIVIESERIHGIADGDTTFLGQDEVAKRIEESVACVFVIENLLDERERLGLGQELGGLNHFVGSIEAVVQGAVVEDWNKDVSLSIVGNLGEKLGLKGCAVRHGEEKRNREMHL